ncbi:MAG: Kelch repeat-containing protein [Oceanicaulis sp.]
MLRTICIIAIASPLFGLVPAAAHAQEDARQWSERGPVSAYSINGPWRPGPRLDSARAGLAGVVHDGVIYAAGGAGLVEPRNDFEALEPDDGAWRARAPLALGLERFGMVSADGRIWIAGGYSSESRGAPIAEMWSYDPESDVWQGEPAMPAAKASFSLIESGGMLYAVGGEDGATDMYVFDLNAREWTTLAAPLETGRRGAAAVRIDSRIWLVGGSRDGETSARVDIYDLGAGEWRRGPDLPQPRAGHAMVALNGAIHILGGRSSDMRQTLRDHLVLDVGASGWRQGVALPATRTEAAAVALGGEIWLIGGGAGAGFFAPFTAVDTVDVLDRPAR